MSDINPQFWDSRNLYEVTRLKPENLSLNLPAEQINFLIQTGLPKSAKCLSWEFNLLDIEIYDHNLISIDRKHEELRNASGELETLYKIGDDTGSTYICIQKSNHAVYYSWKINESNEKYLIRECYINHNVICLAKCLKIYNEFYWKYIYGRNNYYDVPQSEKQTIIDNLEKSLKSVDSTIIGSQPRELDYDGYWSSLMEETYDYLELDLYDEDDCENDE